MSQLELATLQPVLDALQDGVYITDGSGVTLTVNQAYERITGIQRHKVIGKHMRDVVKQGLISRSASLEVIRSREPITLVQTIHDQRQIVVSATPMFTADDELCYVVTNVRDVTELLRAKHAEEQLEQLMTLRRLYGVESVTELVDGQIASSKSRQCYELAAKVAGTSAKVLIQGETGTGKTSLAKYIHQHSQVAAGPFIELNCAAMPEGLLEAELFGYVGGAFTGASSKGKRGLLDAARGGTLFLDEIGDLPMSLQTKLLKVVDEQKYLPVGGTELVTLDSRVITATHHDLKLLTAQGRFREDLYYRLSVVPITLPPLRERREEVIPLLQHYAEQFTTRHKQSRQWHPEALEVLSQYRWPGNIRELMNVTERMVLTATGEDIQVSDLPVELQTPDSGLRLVAGTSQATDTSQATMPQQVAALELQLISAALAEHGNTRAAAAALGIEQSTLVKKQARLRARGPAEHHPAQQANGLGTNE